MKHLYLFIALFVGGLSARAQSAPFTFQYLSQQPYAELAAPVQSVNNGALWDKDSSFPTPLGFTFTFRNQAITTISVRAHGVVFVGAGNMVMNVYFSPFYGSAIQDRGIVSGTASLSPISYAVSGVAGNRIGKVEWKSAGMTQNSPTRPDPTHYVSCQLWLYEQDGRLEVHFGPSLTTATSFSNNFIFLKTMSDGNVAVTPTGDANSPRYIVENCNTPCYGAITGNPALGMVYVFTPNKSFALATTAQARARFGLYPNPARRQLTIDLPGAAATDVAGRLLDAHGRVVHTFLISKQVAPAPVTVALPALAGGLYAVCLRTADGRLHTQRLAIEE